MQDYEEARLAVINLLYGGVGVLLTLALGAFFIVTYLMRTPANEGFMFSPKFKASLILLAITVTAPALLSGYGLLKQKAWAKQVSSLRWRQ